MKPIKSEMAGTLLEWKVKAGDSIKQGQEIAVMESMKMEVPVSAPTAGKITQLKKNPGDFINEGETLAEIE